MRNISGYHILAVLPGIIPSAALTVIKPLLGLERRGLLQVRITLEWLTRPADLEWADLLIFCRNCEPNFASAYRWAVARGIPFIYDIDDNFFELPEDAEDYQYYNSPERQAILEDYLTHAALVRVYSLPMYERVSDLHAKVVRITAPMDTSLVQRPNLKSAKPVKIVYATSRKVDPLFIVFWPALQQILLDYKGQVEAHFWGFFAHQLDGLSGVHYHTPTANYDNFMHQFSKEGFSIGLAPLLDTNFYRSKTNNKFREYGACRVAGIYSNVEVYSECITDGETGLLVENSESAWYSAIARLVEDEGLRQHIQQRSESIVREKYSEEEFEKIWLEQIQSILTDQTLTVPIEDSNHSSVRKGIERFNAFRQISYQVKKAISVLKKDGLASVMERLIFKIEQFSLLVRITLLRKF